MVRIVDRKYLVELVKQNYCYQETNCFYCGECNCCFCKKSKILEEEPRKKKLNTSNGDVNVWKISYNKNDLTVLTIFPVHKNE